MKKIGALFISLVVTMITLSANATGEDGYSYSKLFEAGKTWNVLDKYFDYVTNDTTYVYKQISIKREWNDGNHLLTEVECVNLQTDEMSVHSFLEENFAIFSAGEPPFRKLIDFNLRKGDSVAIEDGSVEGLIITYYYVVNDEIIDIRGFKRRIISIGSEKGGVPFTYWIEGVGSVNDLNMLIFPEPTCSPYLSRRCITSCYMNDLCIFSYEDLENYIKRSGIESVGMDEVGNLKLWRSEGAVRATGEGNLTVTVCSVDGVKYAEADGDSDVSVDTSSLPRGIYVVTAEAKGENRTMKIRI